MAVATLSIDLEARLARLEGDLNRATATIDRQAARMRKSFDDVGASVGNVIKGLAAGVSVGFLANLAKSTIDGIDKLNDLADATGSTVESLSALEDVGARTGTSIDTIGDAVGKLNKLLNDAKPDSDQARALASIGLSAEELKKQDPAEALRLLAVRLAGFADDGNKARLVQDLLGKSYKEAAPFLKDLAAAGQLNATVTTEQAKEAEKFNQELFALQKNATDAARSVSGPLISAINQTIDAFRKGRAEGKGFFATLAGEQLKLLGLGPKEPIAPAVAFRPSQNYGDTLPAVPSLPARSTPARLPRAPAAAKASEIQGPEVPQALADAFKRLEAVDSAKLASLREQLAAIVTLGANGNARALEALPGIVDEIAKIDPEARKAAEALKLTQEEADRLASLLGQTPTGRLKAVTDEVGFLNRQFSAGNIASVEEWAEAVREASQRLGGVKGEAEKVNETANDLGLTFASAFEDAIIGGKKFSEILKGLEQDLLRIFARKLITEPLANAATNFIGSFLGSANGNAFGPGGVIPFANGGIVTQPTLFGFGGGRTGLMGEAGTEGVLPLKRNRQGKLGVIAQGGGSTVNNYSISVQAVPGMSRETAMQQGALIAQGLQRAQARNG